MIEAQTQVEAAADVHMRNEWEECVLHTLKIFHSLSFQDIPEYFEDNLLKWANGFIALLNVPMMANMSTDLISTKV